MMPWELVKTGSLLAAVPEWAHNLMHCPMPCVSRDRRLQPLYGSATTACLKTKSLDQIQLIPTSRPALDPSLPPRLFLAGSGLPSRNVCLLRGGLLHLDAGRDEVEGVDIPVACWQRDRQTGSILSLERIPTDRRKGLHVCRGPPASRCIRRRRIRPGCGVVSASQVCQRRVWSTEGRQGNAPKEQFPFWHRPVSEQNRNLYCQRTSPYGPALHCSREQFA